jgi:hypothetical protein
MSVYRKGAPVQFANKMGLKKIIAELRYLTDDLFHKAIVS